MDPIKRQLRHAVGTERVGRQHLGYEQKVLVIFLVTGFPSPCANPSV